MKPIRINLLAIAALSCLSALGFGQPEPIALSQPFTLTLAPVPIKTQGGPTRSTVRYGGLYNFKSRSFEAVVGGKIEEIDIGSKRFANPEVWAAGATNSSSSTFNAILAEPWYWTPKFTAYPLASASFTDKKLHLGFGLAIQFQVLKF
jgi:hypothetical protein